MSTDDTIPAGESLYACRGTSCYAAGWHGASAARARFAELEAIERRAREMARHESGFGGAVAEYILEGPSR